MIRPRALFPVLLLAGCVMASAGARHRPPWNDDTYFRGDHQPGGATTVADASITGLGRAVGNLEPARWPQMMAGKRIFQRQWSGDATARPGAGLGPFYNAVSCAECHFKDGRGGRPSERDPDVRLLARLAVAKSPDPVYGSQLSERAVAGLPSEGSLTVTYDSQSGVMSDGTIYDLRRPVYRLRGLSWGAPDGNMVLSARMPSALTGMGLLEAIAAQDILTGADPDDRDGDGISGRASWVPDVGRGTRALGRFGWKAAQPSVEQQIATALREDMGLTSWLRPQTACTPSQRGCTTRDHTDEVSVQELEDLTRYVQLLAVPARRPLPDAALARGRRLFIATGCAACHTPRQVTAPQAAFPELTNQVIYPYTDLLLHDMGPGLADELAEHDARGPEWRTPPLWGLGLLSIIHGRLRLLHDGRARSVEEAVLWHDGEARTARRGYTALGRADRLALVRFVESL